MKSLFNYIRDLFLLIFIFCCIGFLVSLFTMGIFMLISDYGMVINFANILGGSFFIGIGSGIMCFLLDI